MSQRKNGGSKGNADDVAYKRNARHAHQDSAVAPVRTGSTAQSRTMRPVSWKVRVNGGQQLTWQWKLGWAERVVAWQKRTWLQRTSRNCNVKGSRMAWISRSLVTRLNNPSPSLRLHEHSIAQRSEETASSSQGRAVEGTNLVHWTFPRATARSVANDR